MKAIILTKKLSNAIEKLAPVCTNKIKPILSGIKLVFKDNTLFLTATNLKLFIKISLPLETLDEEISFVVDAKTLQDVCKNLSEEKTELFFNDGVLVITNVGTLKLPTMSSEEFSDDTFNFPDEKIELPAEEIKKALEKVLFCASNDSYTERFQSVLFEKEKDFLNLVATDGFRLALIKIKTNSEFDSILIPIEGAKQIIKFSSECDKTIEMQVMPNIIHLRFDVISMYVRTLNFQFPDYQKILSNENFEEILINKNQLYKNLKFNNVISNETVELDFQKNILNISSTSKERGQAKTSMEIEGNVSQNLSFNIKFLLEGIKFFDNEKITLLIKENDKPMFLKEENYLQMIMPIRR
jgi:DNA polymerase-3 subunit beta